MPNHVTHKIEWKDESGISDAIFDAVCPDGKFDFETLIPQPAHVYRGGISSVDEQDFHINWFSWNTENWGTKWNCYDQTCGVKDGVGWIEFDTAWSIPYPIISAFCNKFQIPFTHSYFDEGYNFWGIEEWGKEQFGGEHICRISKRKNDPADKAPLCIMLKGYDPDKPDDEEEGE